MPWRFLFIFTCLIFCFFPFRISAQANEFLLQQVSVKNNIVNINFGKKGSQKPKVMILKGLTSATEKLVLDFPNTDLKAENINGKLSINENSEIRMSQFSENPKIARIVIEASPEQIQKYKLNINSSNLKISFPSQNNNTETQKDLVQSSKPKNNNLNQSDKEKTNNKDKENALITKTKPEVLPETISDKVKSNKNTEKPIVSIENNGKKIIIKNASQNIKYKIFHLDSPSRLVIDLLDFEQPENENLNMPELNSSPQDLLIGIRTGKPEKDLKAIRLVFDLSQKKIDFQHELSADKKTLFVNLSSVEKLTAIEKQIKSKSNKNRIKQYKVVIDAGHGGYDAGAIYDGIEEKTITLAIAKNLEKNLKKYKIQTVQTREDDRFVSLDERVNITRQVKPDLFVSIHCNALQTSAEVKGIETYYFTPQSEELAESLHKNIISSTKSNNRYVRKARFVVIRENAVPSTLVETGYLSNKNEREKLSSEKYQNKLGEALGEAVNTYLKESSHEVNNNRNSLGE